MRSFFHQRKSMILIIAIVFVLSLSGGAFTLYVSTPVEPKIVKLAASDVDPGEDANYWRDQYGLTSKQATDVIKHPESYRWILYSCRLNNISGIVDMIDVHAKPTFSGNTKQKVLYFSKDFLKYQIAPREKYRGTIEVLVKMDEGDTPEKLLDMAKQDRFTISGRKYLFLSDTPTNAPLTQFPMGSFSLEAKYEGE